MQRFYDQAFPHPRNYMVTRHHPIAKERFEHSGLIGENYPDCGGSNIVQVMAVFHGMIHKLIDNHTPEEALEYFETHTISELLHRGIGPNI